MILAYIKLLNFAVGLLMASMSSHRQAITVSLNKRRCVAHQLYVKLNQLNIYSHNSFQR